MADETKTPKHPAGSAKGAGTSDAAAPESTGTALVTKQDEHGQQHSLPQATWDALGSKRLATFTDVQPQPAKPADLP